MDASIAKGQEKTADDGLFMERLDMLYEQSLGDLRAFAEREGRAYHEVKRRMAELHCKSLFVGATTEHASSTLERKQLIDRVLRIVSQQLESLENVAGLQSFFLVVNPNDLRDEGFLGGTITGREFWRGHRGCGAAGVEAFKARCVRSQVNAPRHVMTTAGSSHLPPTPQLHPYSDVPRKKSQAREVKAELYGAMRDALRVTSGFRNAEMKWTNHSNLDVYGVRIVGWPDDVPQQNPSTLSVAQNRLILELLNGGKLRFVHMDGTTTAEASHSIEEVPQRDEDMFADSIDYSWVSDGADGNSFTHEAGSFLPGYGKTAESSHELRDTTGMSTDNVEAMTAKKRRIEGS